MAIRLLGRHQTRWENDVKNYLNTMKICNWKDCIQDRHKWTDEAISFGAVHVCAWKYTCSGLYPGCNREHPDTS
jgi:hypothetical protein